MAAEWWINKNASDLTRGRMMKIYRASRRTGRISSLAAALIGAVTLLLGAAGGPDVPSSARSPHILFTALHTPPDGNRQGHHFNENGGRWSGYVAVRSGFESVSASWRAPAVTCNSTTDVVGPWVGLGGVLSASVEQTGIEVSCSSGRPLYRAWYEMAPAAPVYYDNPIRQGDSITAKVRRTGTDYTMTITNNTRHWTRTARESLQGDNASAEVILESPTGAFPNFGKVNFTGATADGRNLGSYHPLALDASGDTGYQDHTGPLSGSTFTISYRHQ
jgi:Peptidase A4 family